MLNELRGVIQAEPGWGKNHLSRFQPPLEKKRLLPILLRSFVQTRMGGEPDPRHLQKIAVAASFRT